MWREPQDQERKVPVAQKMGRKGSLQVLPDMIAFIIPKSSEELLELKQCSESLKFGGKN